MPRSRSNTLENVTKALVGGSSHSKKDLSKHGAVSATPPGSAHASKHRRVDSSNLLMTAAMANFGGGGGMAGLGDIEGPMSTTKALMISVICPRRIGHQVIKEDDDDNRSQVTEATQEKQQPAGTAASAPAAITSETASEAELEEAKLQISQAEQDNCAASAPPPPPPHQVVRTKITVRDVASCKSAESSMAASINTSASTVDSTSTAASKDERSSISAVAVAPTTPPLPVKSAPPKTAKSIPLPPPPKNVIKSSPSLPLKDTSKFPSSLSSGGTSAPAPARDTSRSPPPPTTAAKSLPVIMTKNGAASVGTTARSMPTNSDLSSGEGTPRVGNKSRKQVAISDTDLEAASIPSLAPSKNGGQATAPPPPIALETISEQLQLGNDIVIPTPSLQTAVSSLTLEPKEIPAFEETTTTQGSDDGKLDNKSAKSDSDEETVTAEEAAAVTPGENPDESEVDMEELLRITFDTLLREWHLLNVPTVAYVDHQKLPTDMANPDTVSTHDPRQIEGNWISLNVMIRPSSLGIVLERLERIGVGALCGTLSIFKVEMCKTASPYAHIKEHEEQHREAEDAATLATATVDGIDNGSLDGSLRQETDKPAEIEITEREKSDEADKVRNERMIEAARSEWKNAATRLRIEQVREQIVEQAAFSFDYMSLLIIASILAGVGLITNNSVVIVASMLVSPIMGPVLGLTFGTRIKDWPLVMNSLRNECISLVGCVLVGAVVAIGAAFSPLAETTWPTNEMEIRGEITGLLTGIAIAIPSGMGVCLGILGGNTSSLVGVAISASLLPPAVNSGVCWVYAIVLASGAVTSESNNSAYDFAVIGMISFALTVLNIFCIWIAGIIMFEVKEVAPTREKSPFWARDLKIARELNKTSYGDKPAPINMSKIRAGINSALRRRRKQAGVSEPSERANRNSGPVDDDDKSIVSYRVRPLPPRREVRQSMYGSSQPLSSTWALSTAAPQQHNTRMTSVELWEELPFHGASLDDSDNEEDDEDIKYVGIEDMGALLGLDHDDSEIMDHKAFADRFGRGRYL